MGAAALIALPIGLVAPIADGRDFVVPAGLGISWTIARAARSEVVVPWALSGALLVAVPLVIGVGAWSCSAIAQRIRPVRMSTLTAD
ncbi:MAG: hypothetical protein Q7V57_07430 [Actinomycetota bacterium]|nr:hypothetical protein [Actinomycetota bacterium]